MPRGRVPTTSERLDSSRGLGHGHLFFIVARLSHEVTERELVEARRSADKTWQRQCKLSRGACAKDWPLETLPKGSGRHSSEVPRGTSRRANRRALPEILCRWPRSARPKERSASHRYTGIATERAVWRASTLFP